MLQILKTIKFLFRNVQFYPSLSIPKLHAAYFDHFLYCFAKKREKSVAFLISPQGLTLLQKNKNLHQMPKSSLLFWWFNDKGKGYVIFIGIIDSTYCSYNFLPTTPTGFILREDVTDVYFGRKSSSRFSLTSIQ